MQLWPYEAATLSGCLVDPMARLLDNSGCKVFQVYPQISCEPPSIDAIWQVVKQLQVELSAWICGIWGDLFQTGGKAVLLVSNLCIKFFGDKN